MRLKEIKPGMVIHCTTKDEVLFLLKMFPTNTLTIGLWNTYGNETCLHVNENRTLSYADYNFYFREGYKITEFSDLIIPELSAKEVLETMKEICLVFEECNRCPLRSNCAIADTLFDTDNIIDICTKWREEHPKEEKKELETEWVYVVRIIKVHDNGKKKCVHEVDLTKNEQTGEYPLLEDFVTEQLKKYCSEHKGNFFANLEHICRIKE